MQETSEMGQAFSLATLSAGSAGIDVPELSDLSYEKSLGTARFMKSIRARHQHGLVVVKLVMKPFPQLDLGQYVRAIRCEQVPRPRPGKGKFLLIRICSRT